MSKLNVTPRANVDVDTARWYRDIARQVNGLSEGSMSVIHNAATAAPTSGAWAKGDQIRNSNPSTLGAIGNKYVLVGWENIASGTPGTWVELRCLVAETAYGWRDIIGKVIPKATGAGSPTRAVYIGGKLGQYAFVANDAYDMEFHMPHDYVAGTDIYIHLHWSHNGTTITGNAVFDFYYSHAKGHNQANFGAEKNLTITYATTDIATTPQYRHRIDEVIMSGASATATLMDRDDLEPDGLILMTVRLTTLPTIGGGGRLFIHTADIHYQSDNSATLNKAPNFYA